MEKKHKNKQEIVSKKIYEKKKNDFEINEWLVEILPFLKWFKKNSKKKQ